MTNNAKPAAEVVGLKRVFNGHFKVDQYDIKMDRHEGGTQRVVREVFERGHAVGVLAYDPKRDEVVLVNEMRVGILAAGEYPYTDTVPAGGINAGEAEVDAAVREMMEETGLDLKKPKTIHAGAYVSPGGTSERISIVFGIVDSSKVGSIHGNADEKEDIRTLALSSREFMKRIRGGEINDMKTMLAGYWLVENRPALRKAHAAKPPARKKPGG